VLDYPPRDVSQEFVDAFTAEQVCAEIVAVADAVGAARFAWFGFSWAQVSDCSSRFERID
jgi:hypothetical protein